MTKEFNIFKWDPSIAMPYFVHYYSRPKSSVKYAKRKQDGEQQKPIFGCTSKVLCLTLMSIWLSQSLLNYITIFYSIFSTIWHLLFKKSVSFAQCRLKYIINISGRFKRTHSNYFPRTSKYFTFVTLIRCNEFSEAEVRHEGMLHFKVCIFLYALQNPSHWCYVIKDKHSGVSSSNVTVYYCLRKKVQERYVFMSVCHSVHRGDVSRWGQVPYGIYPFPRPEDTQSMGGHAIDTLQECILVPKKITDVI